MSREVRMVPKNWRHPKDASGRYIPLLAETYERALEARRKWREGFISDYNGGWKLKTEFEKYTEEDYFGGPPDERDHMPTFPEGTATYLMMYETCSEGTPISPAFATPEELARWLADNKASSFGGRTASYEQWLVTCKRGWAPSMMSSPMGLVSGVEAMDHYTPKEECTAHTFQFKSGSLYIHYNSDLSGDVRFMRIFDDETVKEMNISGQVLKEFMAGVIRRQQIAKLEEMSTDEVLEILRERFRKD